MSKALFYLRTHITKFVVEEGGAPLNPFALFDYFLLDTVERDAVRDANQTLVKRCDALWVFGELSDGVVVEIETATRLKKPLRFFAIQEGRIVPIEAEQALLEQGLHHALPTT